MYLQRRVPLWTLVVAVAAVLVLFGIGSAIHSAGWLDGFAMGMLVNGSTDGNALAPYLAYRAGPGWHHGGFGGFFGGFLRILFFLFVIALILKFLGVWRWRMRGPHGPWGYYHGWHHHGQPWPKQESGPAGEDRPQNTGSIHL